MKQVRRSSFSTWVADLQSAGRYTFTRAQALSELGVSPVALKYAILRLVGKARLAAPRRGFYVIVPTEYAKAGAPPPSWFIDDLMKFRQRPYYVGLLSAAAIHGAAHQQPQEFQVITDTPMRPAQIGRTSIHFFYKSAVAKTPTAPIKTETGSMRVSTPEATALDLVAYADGAGGLDNVATVLAELSERMNADLLLEAAKREGQLSIVQRTGHLLDRFGQPALTDPLAKWLAVRKTRLVPLRPERNPKVSRKDPRWNVIVNEVVEAEE